jgi:hypothetical protein
VCLHKCGQTPEHAARSATVACPSDSLLCRQSSSLHTPTSDRGFLRSLNSLLLSALGVATGCALGNEAVLNHIQYVLNILFPGFPVFSSKF